VIYVYMYIYIYMDIYIYTEREGYIGTVFSLYMILSLLILYGVWHIKGGSGGGHILRKSRAIVLQLCGR